jgi:DNA-binding transcriptional ArsR family regulator
LSGGELTARQREVAELAARMLSLGEIAGRLGISQRTVSAHLSAVYAKTGTGVGRGGAGGGARGRLREWLEGGDSGRNSLTRGN